MSTKQGTWIDGIAASEHLDSSGERIEIQGIDLSSLNRDGVFNWEHKNEGASHIVGKIYEAKKIFKKSDCENDRQKYFWDKVQMPYIYVAGELFDGVGHTQAQEVASMLKYDEHVLKNSKNKETKKLINFSIEGSKLKSDGNIIKKCIARKVSITLLPCNKTCEAEIMPKEGDSTKFVLESILNKCEIMKAVPKRYYGSLYEGKKQNSEKTSFKPKPKMAVGAENMKPSSPITLKRSFESGSEPKNLKVGDRITYNKKPKSGKDLYSDDDTFKKEKTMKVKTKDMVDEHKELVDVLESPSHKDDKKEAKKQRKELKEYKEKMKKKEDDRCWEGYEPTPGKKAYSKGSCRKKKKKLTKYDSNVRKALVAGSGMSAPETKVQEDAVSKKEIAKNLCEENWKTFTKKEQLIDFLSEKLPNTSHKGILALAKTVAFYRTKKQEYNLSKLIENDLNKSKGSIKIVPHPKEVEDVDPKIIADMKAKLKESKKKKKKDGKKVKDIMDDSVQIKKAKVDEGLSSKEKKQARAERKDFKPHIKEGKEERSKRKLIDEPKHRESKLKQIKNKPKQPSKEDLEYPSLAASEKAVSLTSKDKSKKGGLTQSGRDKYNKATGGNLKAPVTKEAAKKSPKKASRRKSFCARMSGAKGKMYEYKDTDRDGKKEKVPTRKKKALDRWDC